MKLFYKWLLALSILVFFGTSKLSATHIRAGEIIVERISTQSLTFRITIIAYTDTDGVEFGGGTLNFGDGTEVPIDTEKEFSETRDLGNKVAVNIFVIEHTYPAPGLYTLRFLERNRNDNILNMVNSVNTPFYIETKMLIDPFIGLNNSPQLLVPPIDRAASGVAFFHNPGAFDPDGDSLAYRIVIPKQDIDKAVFDYKFPNENVEKLYGGFDYNIANETADGSPTYTLDPITGDLVWDAPGRAGEYNVAFVVEEWRKIGDEWFLIGCVTRDMQIIVEETDNERPELIIPKDTCVVAGTLLEETIQGQDPDGHNIILESFGGVYELPTSPASFSPNPPVVQSSPGTLDFTWQTNCFHVRQRPYEIQFKVTDDPPPQNRPALVKFETWNVTVIGPPPEGLAAAVQPGRAIQLNWDAYNCSNASVMQIYRRVDEFNYEPGPCETGIPANSGYELIGTVDITEASFLDDNNGDGLDPGANYCYRLVAVFPQPGGGESIVSEEVCAEIAADAPVITNVDITNTGTNDGTIWVRWTSPLDADPVNFPPPYRYEVARANDFEGNNGLTVVTSTTDTTFTDTGLNTRDEVFNYRIYLYDANDVLVDSSATASTVRLELEPFLGGIELNWSAEVPWSNNVQDFAYHYIYRNRVNNGNPDQLVLIDSVNVLNTGFNYLDEGQNNNVPLEEELEYCYFVTTQGSYGNDRIIEPLLNKSQIICAQPNDTIPPCTPVNLTLASCEEILQDLPCNVNFYSNTISWMMSNASECDLDIRSYNVYFAETLDSEFQLLANVTDTFYVHQDLQFIGGCYRVAAVDRSNNESEISEPVCQTLDAGCLV
ncbi:gliding motility-associated C-terminal domain-containing protein, partial [Fulvivirgaceae bacterium BMA10]|nr:gliding motility-associated C-terminal domain-containing protein [Fulvivirgaceae bacterium BMA10]